MRGEIVSSEVSLLTSKQLDKSVYIKRATCDLSRSYLKANAELLYGTQVLQVIVKAIPLTKQAPHQKRFGEKEDMCRRGSPTDSKDC